MPSARYYKQQAKVLVELASISRDPNRAARLMGRAIEYLTQAGIPEDPTIHNLTAHIDEFNNLQLRKS
jgi:hypothetical protein